MSDDRPMFTDDEIRQVIKRVQMCLDEGGYSHLHCVWITHQDGSTGFGVTVSPDGRPLTEEEDAVVRRAFALAVPDMELKDEATYGMADTWGLR